MTTKTYEKFSCHWPTLNPTTQCIIAGWFHFLFTQTFVFCPFWRNLGSQGYWLLYRRPKTKSCEGKYISLLFIVKGDKKRWQIQLKMLNIERHWILLLGSGHSLCLLHLSNEEFELIWWLLWNLPEGSSIFHQQWRESKDHQRRSTTQFLPSASCKKCVNEGNIGSSLCHIYEMR